MSRSAALLAAALLQALAAACTPAAVVPGGDADEALLTSMQVYTSGEDVNFLLQVTNVTEGVVELNFPTAQTYDFIVTQNGAEIWRWSEGQMFSQAVHQIRLEPGETIRSEAEWRVPRAAEGEYEVRGVLPASAYRVEQATRFELR